MTLVLRFFHSFKKILVFLADRCGGRGLLNLRHTEDVSTCLLCVGTVDFCSFSMKCCDVFHNFDTFDT